MRGEHVPRAAVSESTRERTTLAENRHAVVRDAIADYNRLGAFQLSARVTGWKVWEAERWVRNGAWGWLFLAELSI